MKYLSLILLLSFITIVLSFTGCCQREGLDDPNCSCYPGNFKTSSHGCGNVGSTCCREPNQNNPKPICKDGPCACYDGYVQVNEGGCSSVGGAPCCRHPNGHVWKPFCKKKDTPSPPAPAPAPPPPTTYHPAPSPPHAPWNIDQHIAHIQNPIISHGEFNSPLPQQKATFLKRETLNPAPAPKQ
jgi:hypothetical protein